MRTHRLRLHRRVPVYTGGTVLFCMLNPSKATCMCERCRPRGFSLGELEQSDPTVRKVIGFAARWRYARANVVNAYALISTDPKELRRVEPAWAVGEGNDDAIREEAADADLIVAAWGVHIGREREREVLDILKAAGRVYRLGWASQGGHPRHPLYLPYNTKLDLHA